MSSPAQCQPNPRPDDLCICNAEAETLQQRAERKRGREAVSAYEQAAVGEVYAQLRLALSARECGPNASVIMFAEQISPGFGLGAEVASAL